MDKLAKVLYQDLTIKKVWDLLEKSEVKVNFWGSRIVSVKGYASNVHLASFAGVVQRLVGRLTYKDIHTKLSLDNRLYGLKSVKKITEYYKGTDQLLKEANCITKLFAFFREFFNLQGDSKRSSYFGIDVGTPEQSSRYGFDFGINSIEDSLKYVTTRCYARYYPQSKEYPETFIYEGETFNVGLGMKGC